MDRPEPQGTEVGPYRMGRWVSDYSGYRIPVTEGRIERWLAQFDAADRDVAARLLDAVDFVGNDQISAAFREALNSLEGWHVDPSRRTGRFLFLPFSSSGGESGDSMLYRFRTANNLGHRRHNQLFPHWSELLKIAPGPGDTVVFVDDFSGTGDQACTAWKEVFQELLPFGAQVILILVACSVDARERIREETDMIPHCQIELTSADRLFREECRHFNEEEKETILKYCRVADPDAPMGYGKCGFVLVMAHKAPNNSVPVLHARRRGWEGLFRRHD